MLIIATVCLYFMILFFKENKVLINSDFFSPTIQSPKSDSPPYVLLKESHLANSKLAERSNSN